MILTYAGRSRLSAQAIADEGGFDLNRGPTGDVNWGRASANTELNPDISNSTNKRVMRELFEEHGVPMPRLVDPFDDLDYSYPLVGRPDQHTKGRGYWLCHNANEVFRAWRGTRRKKAATHFMEFVDAEHEIRVHIFKGKSIRISEKLFNDSESGPKYTTIKPTCRVNKARKAAKQAVEALGLDFGAVDVLVQEDGTPFVLEVNAAPGLGGTLPELYARVFQEWYDLER